MACTGQLFGLLLIPIPVFGVDSTPRMGEWVGGWNGAIRDDFSSWTCPFPLGDMDRPLPIGDMHWPLSSWGYGPAPFQLGIWTGPFPSPIVPHITQCDAFQGYNVLLCIVKQARWVGHMVIPSACLLWSITFCPSCPQTSFAICCGVEHWGQGVQHQVYPGFKYPRSWLAFCMMGMWSWSMIKVVCKPSIIDAPWSPSPVSSLHHHPHQFPQLTSLRKFLWTPMLIQALFAVAPQHDCHHIP